MDPRVSLTPELVQDRVIGALGVGDLAGRSFGAEEIEIVRAFADQAAIVLENHQLYGELREALTAVRASQEQLVATERLQAVGTLVALILNAVEALPGGGRITLRTWATPEVVYCAVVDSGNGLSDEVRHRALEPFFTTKGPRHQGLGLSLAYGIIRRHRGELEIPRNEGQGRVVTFHLPPHRPNGRRP